MINPWYITSFVLQTSFTFLVVVIWSIVGTLISVCVIVLKLFAELRKSTIASEARGGPALSNFENADTTLRFVIVIALLATAIMSTISGLMAWDPFFLRNYYLFVPVLLNCGSLVVIIATVIFAWRMS